MIHLLCFTNGRGDCLRRTLESFEQNVYEPSSKDVMWSFTIINDSPDPNYREWLEANYGSPDGGRTSYMYNLVHTGGNAGFDGAIRAGWAQLGIVGLSRPHGDYVFHLEDDFTFNEQIDVPLMMDILAAQPHLVQIALQRQPWAPIEEEAGGVIASNRDQYIQREAERSHSLNGHNIDELGPYRIAWCEHRLFFTTNPSIYRCSLVHELPHGWPVGEHSEARFADALYSSNPEYRSAYLGGLYDPPKVHHIGDVRLGTRY